MADAENLDGNERAPSIQDEDAETLEAIDEGIRDAGTGRTVPVEEVRKLLPEWITGSSSRKEP